MSLLRENCNIAIIGRGKVGQSLTQLFSLKGYKVTNVGRSKKAQLEVIKTASLIFLCVDDSSIKSLCTELSPHFQEGSIVSHCSGALDSSVLITAQKSGYLIASTHPLNTFPNLESALSLFSSCEHGSYLYAEGQPKALETLLPLFETSGFNCLTIERESKPLYHAACVFACNYLTSLMDMSLQSATAAGLDKNQFWESVQPLVRSTLENISKKGITNSLSGPIARGDTVTIETHIQILQEHSNSLKSSYTNLGLSALEIAVRKNELTDNQLESLRKTLSKTD